MAVKRLQEAYAGGHISHEEMDQGLGQVLTATTHAELMRGLAALPDDDAAEDVGGAGGAGTTSTIAAAGGRIRRRGAWRVPRTLKVESGFGKVRLNLSRAIIEHPVIDIELQLGTGNAKIIVPRDATVDVGDLRTVWKDTLYRHPRRAPAGGPTIRISGTMRFGRLKIRHARR